MISIEGRLPISLNKNQLIRFAEAEVHSLQIVGYSSRFLKIIPGSTGFKLNDISLDSAYGQLSGNIDAVMPFRIVLPLCECIVYARPKLKFGLDGAEISQKKIIESLNLEFSSLELSGVWSMFGNTIRKNIASRIQKLIPEVLNKINSVVKELLARKFKLDFDLNGLHYTNLLSIKSIAIREFCTDLNSIHLDVNTSLYIENLDRNFSANFTDIDRKEHADQFHVAVHQDFIHSIAKQIIKEIDIPVLNKKIPLILESFKIENGKLHAVIQVTELYKGSWNLQLDTRIENNVLKFSVRHLESLTGGSIIDRGVTKLLELGIEKLLSRYAEVPLAVVNQAIAGVLRSSYHIELDKLTVKLNVPQVLVTNLELPDQNALLTCDWQGVFYVEL